MIWSLSWWKNFQKSLHFKNVIIILATHSTNLIEKVANLQHRVNIISIDNDKKVGNSKNDVDLINALQRNGVKFSSLMLSKRINIFVENKIETGKEYINFLLKFFPLDHQPNIIPIGHSGNVDDSESFSAVLQEMVNVSDISSIGIQDGDVWFKNQMLKYLKSEIDLQQFIDLLNSKKEALIQINSDGRLSNYFNFWEIENLYLTTECIECWISKDGISLTQETYLELAIQNKDVIIREYLKTFYKMITNVRITQKGDPQIVLKSFNDKVQKVQQCLTNPDLLDRMTSLIDSLLANKLMNWLPGKEYKKLLQGKGYIFDDSKFIYNTSYFATKLQSEIDFYLK